MDAYETPYRHWVADHEFEPLSAAEMKAVSSLKFEVAYGNDVEQGKFTLRDPELMPPTAARVLSSLRDPERLKFWSLESQSIGLDDDPALYGGGMAVMAPGGWLQGHTDFAVNPFRPHMERRLSLIAFLNPEWESRWGGQLLLMDPMGKTVCAITPRPGRLVVFENSDLSIHGVRQIAKGAPMRVSVAVYYHGPRRPEATRMRSMWFPNRESPLCPKEVS